MSSDSLSINERKRGAIIGSAVADAASLGFHWLYDQARIRTLEPTTPEFRQPSPDDYNDVRGYFAHDNKQSGEFSQYGEQHRTMLESLAENEGVYDKPHYESTFVKCFGFGGSYSGYIDHPTRDTLTNIISSEKSAFDRATNLPFNGSDELKRKLLTKVLGNAKQATGNELKRRVEAAVRLTDDDDYLVQHALNMLAELDMVNVHHGADDTQLPALSKLPSLVAAYAGSDELLSVVESAIRVTNNNDSAVAFGKTVAKVIEDSILVGEAKHAVDAAITYAKTEYPDNLLPLLEQSLAELEKTTPEVTAQWGMACQLKIGFPSAIHNISKSSSYTEAVRQNIYAGGDSCGRSILVGAVMGACCGVGTQNGIPNEWIAKLNQDSQIMNYLNQLVPTVST